MVLPDEIEGAKSFRLPENEFYAFFVKIQIK